MRAFQPKQLSGLFGGKCGDHAFKRPAWTKTLPVCRTLNPYARETFRANLKIQDPALAKSVSCMVEESSASRARLWVASTKLAPNLPNSDNMLS